MTFISKAAFAVALAAGTAAVATPAIAQKKKEEAKAPQLKLSDAVRKPVAAAQTALAANDTATATAQLATAQSAATTDDEKYIVAALKLQVAAKANDRATMLPQLDALIANPRTPASDLARYNYFRGTLAFEQKKYAEALPFLTKSRDLGFQDSSNNLPLQIAQAQIETGNVQGGVAEIQKAIDAETAAGRKAPEAWYNYATARVYTAGDRAGTAVWLQRTLKAYPTPTNWRKSILVYRDDVSSKGAKPLDKSQRIDLFRLMRATKSLAGGADYLEYANDANSSGLAFEGKAVIEEGRATGKIPAGDASAARLLAEANASIKADKPLPAQEASAKAAADGKLAASTGDVYLAQSNFTKAIEFYKLALQKGGVDPSATNLRLGMALTQAGQKDAALAALNAVTAPPRSDMAGFWKTWIEQQGATPAAPAAPAATN